VSSSSFSSRFAIGDQGLNRQIMPDIRKHRGAHPDDKKLFAAEQLPSLRMAVGELSWLLTRDYSLKGALKLVGDRHTLTDRQRLAVARAACSDQSKERRAKTLISIESMNGESLIVDGFNLIITVEAALSGGVLLVCRDDCIRDLSSVHGSYRAVSETVQAIELIGETLATLGLKSVVWLLDRPISNSGRLANRIRQCALEKDWNWSVEVVFNPDAEMAASDRIVISSDSHLLDQVPRWLNLNRVLIDRWLAASWLIDLSC
jgi:hypothetical protein